MDREIIALKITDFLRSVSNCPSLTATTHLLESGVIDSLTMMDLVGFVEREFDIHLHVSEFTPGHFETSVTLSELVQSKVTAKQRRHAA